MKEEYEKIKELVSQINVLSCEFAILRDIIYTDCVKINGRINEDYRCELYKGIANMTEEINDLGKRRNKLLNELKDIPRAGEIMIEHRIFLEEIPPYIEPKWII